MEEVTLGLRDASAISAIVGCGYLGRCRCRPDGRGGSL